MARIAHHAMLPPFAEVRGGRTVGLVVDIVLAAAKRVGLEASFIGLPMDQLEPALEEGKADAIFPLAVTPQRAVKLDFTDTLLMTGGALFVREGDELPTGLAALSGKRVATPAAGPLVGYIAKAAPDVRLMVTQSYEASIERLIAGEVEGAALNVQAGAMIARDLFPGRVRGPSAVFLELPFAAAVLKGRNAGLIEHLNAGLSAIRADGTWQRIQSDWMRSDPS